MLYHAKMQVLYFYHNSNLLFSFLQMKRELCEHISYVDSHQYVTFMRNIYQKTSAYYLKVENIMDFIMSLLVL